VAEGVVKDGRVQLRDANGNAASVEEKEVGQALAGGEFRLESAEEYEARARAKERSTAGQKAITAGEGALRGATFGLGTAAAAELGGEEYRRAARERQAENPNLAIGAEIAGSVLPSLLSGGSGAVGAAARLSPAALAGRAAGAVERGAGAILGSAGGQGALATAARAGIKAGAGAAIETSLYGMGSELADASLEGVDWTAERALAGLLSGAELGGKAGGAIGAGGVIAGRIAKRAARETVDAMLNGGKTLKRAVGEWAEERAATSIAGKGADDADELVAALTNNGANPERLERMAAKVRESGLETASRSEVATIARREAEAAAVARAEAEATIIAAGAKPNPAQFRETLASTYEDLVEAGAKDAAGKMKHLLKTRPHTIAEAEQLAGRFEEVVSWARSAKSEALPELERTAQQLSSHIDDVAADAGPSAQQVWKTARQEASDWKDFATKIGKAPLTDAEVGRVIGLAGTVASIATGGVLPYLAAATVGQSPAVRQFVRERGGAALGWIASRAGLFERATNSVAKRIAGGGGDLTAVGALGKEAAPSVTPARALLGGTPAAGQPKAPRRSFLESVQLDYPLLSDKRESTAARYGALTAAIIQNQSNPRGSVDHFSEVIAPIARSQPEVATAMSRILTEDQEWLESQMPQPLGATDSMSPLAAKPVVTHREQKRLVAYANALAKPMDVFESIGDGHVDWDGIEALKARRPELWEAMRGKVILETSQRTTPLPLRKRQLLGLVFDFDGDWSMQNIGAIQKVGAQPADAGNGKPGMSNIDTGMNALPGQPGAEEAPL
jgi:hypothetical protein